MNLCFTLVCGLLAVTAAVTEASDEIESRIENRQPTMMLLQDGSTVSVPPGILLVAANGENAKRSFRIAYKEGNYDPYGVTIVSCDSPGRIIITTARTMLGLTLTEVQSSMIEVETALSEIVVPDYGLEDGYAPWRELADALKKAPHSPRLSCRGGLLLLGGHAESKLVYDRRTKNVWYWIRGGGVGETSHIDESVERGIGESEIEKRAAGERKLWPDLRRRLPGTKE